MLRRAEVARGAPSVGDYPAVLSCESPNPDPDMYRFWEPIIEPLMERLEPSVIVEIGSDHGHNTKNLLQFARHNGGVVHVIDPLPKYAVEEWEEEFGEAVVFHKALSLEALPGIGGADVVLIDGDHNWYTVLNELRVLASWDGELPMVLLHDVGWPYGRRDLYYDPQQIPEEARQPHEKAGMTPGQPNLIPGGGLNSHLDNAVNEGGPRNGVLTAVEDFIDESDVALELLLVPGVYSLGILFPASLRSHRPAVSEFLSELAASPSLLKLLAKLESLRLELQLEWLDAVKGSEATRSELAAVALERDAANERIADLESRIENLESLVLDLESDVLEAESLELVERRRADAAEEGSSAKQRELNRQIEQRVAVESLYTSLRNRRSVRAALGLASLSKPVFQLLRGSDERRAGESTRRGPTARDQSKLAQRIIEERPGSTAESGPMVSIVVLTRDGANHMRRLLAAFDEKTTYRSFEVIVVDNASTDDTADVLAEQRGYPLRVIQNTENLSFSEGNNQGAEQASGDLLLLLNNDIEPVNPGWLGAMVEAAAEEGVGAVGAELVYPVRGDADTDLTAQHVGIRFGFRDGSAHAMNIGNDDPLDPSVAGSRAVPAATAAALMVQRATYLDLGGLDTGYVYGTEDVDFCLRVAETGSTVVVTGQAVLFHHESATQARQADEVTKSNRQRNWARFSGIWGPRLTRSILRDRLTGAGRWAPGAKPTVAITLTHDDPTKGWGDYYTAHELGDQFEQLGWRVLYAERFGDHWYELGDEVDLLVSLLDAFDVDQAPSGAVTLAWVRNWTDRWLSHPWFGNYDFVAVSSRKAANLVASESRFAPAMIPLATNPERFAPGEASSEFACDYSFTGNNWGEGREIVDLLEPRPTERFRLFGKGWEEDERVAAHWQGHLDYDRLPDLYRSSRVVLDDTATPTLPYAFVNGRVFDALAAGALVISDNRGGSEELFGGLLPTYSNRQELRELLDHYLGNEEERLTRARDLREMVMNLFTYSQRPSEFVGSVLNHIERPRVAIKIGVPSEEEMPKWGDTHFADGMASALTKVGWPAEVHILPDWDNRENQAADVVIHVRGLSRYEPKLAHVNVLWIISHPDDVSVQECEKYDLVLVASQLHADRLSETVSVPVVFVPQATDSRRFHPTQPEPELATEVLFVGNSRNQKRPVVDWSIEQRLPLAVYGSGWRGRIPSRYVKAEHFPNRDLNRLYASAKVVLNDHWPDMRERGFISNRIYDAVASGAVVVSDDVVGLREAFGDAVVTYSNPSELRSVVERLLSDDAYRTQLATAGSQRVLENHTFGHRAAQVVEAVTPILEGRGKDLDRGSF